MSAIALAVALSSPSPALARTSCNVRNVGQSLGPSYVTSLSVDGGVSCATGETVVRAYYRCRVANGGVKGTCHKSILGYHCSETRTGISIQFDASVTCRHGPKRVYHTYTENT